jgi:DNA-binding PadR family transcriptional regulator
MSKVDLVILGLLAEEPRHGYDILQQIENRSMKHWVGVSTPAIYKGLERLATRGILESRSESCDRHPDRTVYTITDQGRDLLQQMLKEAIAKTEQPHFNMLMGIGFGHHIGQEGLLVQLEQRRQGLQEALLMIGSFDVEQHEHAACDILAAGILDYYSRLVTMEIGWLEKFIGDVKQQSDWPKGEHK